MGVDVIKLDQRIVSVHRETNPQEPLGELLERELQPAFTQKRTATPQAHHSVKLHVTYYQGDILPAAEKQQHHRRHQTRPARTPTLAS